ncbi:MAG: DsrE family protein [Lysobacterales bacterium]|jgi:sulfur relay (sulfurtransferase) DsrF/TusC family protein
MGTPVLGLLVRSGAYAHRSARADVDIALATAALDIGLEVYFLGDSVTQLAATRDPGPALLPPGYRAWAGLPELGAAHLFAEQGWLERCEQLGLQLSMGVEGLDRDALLSRWRRCTHTMVL